MIQHLPWESIPTLVDHSVTRMPSVHFLFAHWKSLSDDPASVLNVGVSRRSVYYIVNPDNDLMHTQKTFESWFSRFAPINVTPKISRHGHLSEKSRKVRKFGNKQEYGKMCCLWCLTVCNVMERYVDCGLTLLK